MDWPDCEEWLSACNVKKTDYHGGSFAGNESRSILKKVDRLQNLCPNGNEVVVKFVCASKNFDEVVSACYGDDLAPNFLEKIENFSKSYKKLKKKACGVNSEDNRYITILIKHGRNSKERTSTIHYTAYTC